MFLGSPSTERYKWAKSCETRSALLERSYKVARNRFDNMWGAAYDGTQSSKQNFFVEYASCHRLATGDLQQTLEGHADCVELVAFSPGS